MTVFGYIPSLYLAKLTRPTQPTIPSYVSVMNTDDDLGSVREETVWSLLCVLQQALLSGGKSWAKHAVHKLLTVHVCVCKTG